MSDRIILPLAIINKIKDTCAPQGLIEFDIKRLVSELKKCVEKNEAELIRLRLLEKINHRTKFYSKDTIKDAISRKPKRESGAKAVLRNLLCYYAYRLDWIQTLKHIGLVEKDIIEESNKIKNTQFTSTQNDQGINKILEEINQTNKRDHNEDMEAHAKTHEALMELLAKNDSKKTEEDREKNILDAIKNNKTGEMSILLEQTSKEVSQKFHEAKRDMIMNLLSLSFLAQKEGNYIKCASLIDEALSLKKDNAVAYFTKARSLVFEKKYSEALVEIDHSIKIEPGFGNALLLKGAILFLLDKSIEAKKTYDDLMGLIATGKFLSLDQVLLKIYDPNSSLNDIEKDMYLQAMSLFFQQFVFNMTIFLADLNLYDQLREFNKTVVSQVQMNPNLTLQTLLIFFAGWIKVFPDEAEKVDDLQDIMKNTPKDISEAKAFYKGLIWF